MKNAVFLKDFARERFLGGALGFIWGVHLLSVGSLRVSSPFWLGLTLGASLGVPFWVPFSGSLFGFPFEFPFEWGPEGPPLGALPQGGPSDCIRV